MRMLIYGLIALAPLPLASARPAWQWLWVLVVAVAAVVYLFQARRTRPMASALAIKAAVVGISVFIAWGFLQALVPMGAGAVFDISSVDNILSASGVVSVDPAKTLSNALFFLSHLVFFILVYQYCSRREKTVNFIRFCGVIGSLYAAYGFIVFVSGNDTILWFEKWANQSSLTSTFVNRNSFAAYVGLGLQCLIAYAFFWAQDELAEGRTGRELYRHVLETMLTKAWWLPLAILLCVVALMLTNSRAGFGSGAVAIFLLFLLSPNRYGDKNSGWGSILRAATVVAIGVGVFSLSGEMLDHRLQSDASLDQRFSIYPIVLDAMSNRPIVGYGLGTFEDVFRVFRDDTVTLYFVRAHSDYLEVALTAGILAAVLLVVSIAALVFQLVASLKFGNQYRSFIVLGITASVQLALHSLVDFSLQIPAVSYLWCAIIAASLAAAHRCKRAVAAPA